MANPKSITIRDAEILPGNWRNFKGEEGQYTREGDRNFNMVIPPEIVEELRAEGWNVKDLPPRDEEDPMRYRLDVAVSYKGRPPVVYYISGGVRTLLDESLVGILDTSEIAKADVVLNPYDWTVQGNTGRKAYLEKIYVTVVEDELDQEYSSIPFAVGD